MRLPAILRRPAAADFPLQTRALAAPFQVTPAGITAWFVLEPLNWEFLPGDLRVGLWDAQRSRWGLLAETCDHPNGRGLQIRRTSRPYAAREWAAQLDGMANPSPAVPGADSWNDYLAHGQRRLRSTGLDQRYTAAGLWIAPVPSKECLEDLVSGTEHPRTEAVQVLERFLEVRELMAGGGLNGRPATAADMEFLLHRSLAMGIPAPSHAAETTARWDESQLGEFTERVRWSAEPNGTMTRIDSEAAGQSVHRHVQVLSTRIMPDLTWPERGEEAWMVAADRLGFPVEWSMSGRLLKGSLVEGSAVFDERKARAIDEHYREHQMDPPPAVVRGIAAAIANLDEVTTGTNREAPRFEGTVRAAVWGATPDEARDRGRKLASLYHEALRMPLAVALGQPRQLREFTPGEPRAKRGWTRRFNVGYLAGAMPNIDSAVGTPAGPYLGYTSLSHRAVLSDLHYGPEVLNSSGLITISSAPGGGKSVLIGAYAYSTARAGEATVLYDPSGPLGALTRIPELAPYSRELNLARADEGTLAPHSLIPDPRREDYPDDGGGTDELEYRRAVRMAKAERQQLLFDALRMLLSQPLLKTRGVDKRLQEAVRSMGSDSHGYDLPETRWNPRWALDYLGRRADELGREIHRELVDAAEFPLGSLIIPDHTDPLDPSTAAEQTLVVVTMPGLEPPPADLDREHWGAGERMAQPLLHLAAFFASRFIYSRLRTVRKNIFLDENHMMARWGSGRAFVTRLSRDSRKWNTGVVLSSQDPDDHLAIGKLDALVGGTFVGRLPSESAALRGCRALDISPDYAPVFMGLESGEFVHRDQRGRVAKMKVDMDWHPSLASLATTPGHKRAAYVDEPAPAPFLEPRLFGVTA